MKKKVLLKKRIFILKRKFNWLMRYLKYYNIRNFRLFTAELEAEFFKMAS